MSSAWMVAMAVLVAVGAGVGWRWHVRRRRSPWAVTLPPDEIEAARRRAQTSLARFRELYERYPQQAQIRWPFTTSKSELQYLTADVLACDDEHLQIRLASPPIDHLGDVERHHWIAWAEVADWTIEFPDGRRAGGFSQRALFAAAEKQWGGLPDEMAHESMKYVDDGAAEPSKG